MTRTESLFNTILLLQHLAELQRTDNIDIYYIDLFCGAGGTSTGVELATINGKLVAKVIACVNHDKNAIASHMANHPYALHFTEDMRTLGLQDRQPLFGHTTGRHGKTMWMCFMKLPNI